MTLSFLLFSSTIKKTIPVILLLSLLFGASAQELVQIKGKISSENDGELLPGVSIKIKNSPGGTTSNVDGTYSLRVTRGVTLVFSYIGYMPQEVLVGKNNVINVNFTIFF